MSHQLSTVLIVVLVLFAVYRRVRRNIGFQKLNRKSLLIRALLFIVLGLLILAESMNYPIVYISDAVGLVIGFILAFYAAATAQFELRGKSWFYRTNGWIGGIVLAIFLGRLVYRFYALYNATQDAHGTAGAGTANIQYGSYLSDPWGSGLIFVILAYYSCYAFFMLRKEKQLGAAEM